MGHQNVARALIADCGKPAKLVLVTMALHSLDPGPKTTDPLHYYAGWPLLAISLGYPSYDKTAERAVARAVQELVDSKWITVVDRTARGGRVYHLQGLST